MRLNDIILKIDSIQIEADSLYHYEQALLTSKDLLKTFSGATDSYECLVYRKKDSTKVLFIKDSTIAIEYNYKSDLFRPITILKDSRPLSKREKKLIMLKRKIKLTLKNEEYLLDKCTNCWLDEQIMPYQSGYKYYFLSVTNEKDVIPF